MLVYDLIIIGAGPAGISASVYAARKRLNVLVISKNTGGQAATSGDIENYTGYQFITGPELAVKFQEHMRKFNIQLKEDETVTDIEKSGNKISVKTDKDQYLANALIIASGKRSKQIEVPGEREFSNKGVSYCATCDAPLFQGKDVAVVGGGNSALDAAIQLMNIAGKVYIINIAGDLTADPIMIEKIKASPSVTIFNNTVVTEIFGERFVSGIKILRDGVEKEISCQGVFVEIGLVTNVSFASSVEKNDLGEIKVDNCNRTNVPGIFAAGDVTDIPEKQIIIAAGEGAKAALCAYNYLIRSKF